MANIISSLCYCNTSIYFVCYFVPNVPINEILAKSEAFNDKQEEKDRDLSKGSFLPVLGYVLLIFIVAILYMTMGIKVTTLMTTSGYGTATDGSTVILMIGLGAMISGFLFGRIIKVTQRFTLPIAFLLLASAMFIIGFSNSVFFTAIGGLLTGFGFRMVMPYLINSINSGGSIKNSGLATSALLVGYNLGASLSPYGAIIIQKISWVKSLRGIFYTDGTILAILAVCGAALAIFYSRKKGTNYIEEKSDLVTK